MWNNYEYEKDINMKNIIYCDINNGSLNINYWIKVLNDSDERKNILQKGIDKANEFYSNIFIDLSNNTLNKF